MPVEFVGSLWGQTLLAGQNVVLTVVQLFLVNIVMDTLAALAALVLPADLIRNLLCRR